MIKRIIINNNTKDIVDNVVLAVVYARLNDNDFLMFLQLKGYVNIFGENYMLNARQSKTGTITFTFENKGESR